MNDLSVENLVRWVGSDEQVGIWGCKMLQVYIVLSK